MTRRIYFSRFLPSEEKGGGCRRLLQVLDVLRKMDPGIELIHPFRSDLISEERMERIKRLKYGNILHRFILQRHFIHQWSPDHREMVSRFDACSRLWLHSVPGLEKIDLVVMDDPIYFRPLFKKLIRLRIPVIAVCHNLESLVSGQVRQGYARELLKTELELLSQCRLVISISREEDVLLRNFGINSQFLPYFPVEPIQKRLLAVREKRKASPKKDVLMIGTFKNFPTRDGMSKAASFWSEHFSQETDDRLIAGGFFSENCLKPLPVSGNLEFLGTLSNEALDRIMENVKAFLCYQENGAGALTRICEMLLAGIPVLANTHAARSYYHKKGVFEFRELSELKATLEKAGQLNEEIPLPTAPAVSDLCEEIKKIMGSR